MTTGANAHVNFVWEDNGFRQEPTDNDYKVFGGDTRVTQFEGSHNAARVFNPGSREAIDIVEQAFDGALSVEFNLADPWFLRGPIAEPSTTDNGDGTYTHTFDGESLTPMRVLIGDVAAGDEIPITGVVPGSLTINAETGGEHIPCTLDCAYAESGLDEDVGAVTEQATLDMSTYHFGHAEGTIGGDRVARIQSGSITIANNVDMIREWGDRRPVDYSAKARTPDVSLTKIKEPNADRLSDFYGSSGNVGGSIGDNEVETTFVFSRGSGADAEEIAITAGGTFPESYDMSTIGDPQEDIEEDLTRYAKTVSATATNAVADAR